MADQRASGAEGRGGIVSGGMTNNHFLKKPLYLQLRDALAERISAGTWKPGAAIPNESDLAREFGVSAGTMRKALDMMETDRLLTRRQGRGTFVNDQASDVLARRFSNLRTGDGQRLDPLARTTHVAEDAPSEEERLRLELGPDDRIYRVHRTRLHKNQPFMVEHAVVPADLFPGLDKKEEVAIRIIVLAQQHGVLLGKAEERISIGQASQPVAEVVGVAPGRPVMVLDRIVRALDGRVVEWRVGWLNLVDKYYKAEMV
jgi:GntR family transcriptional regulator